MKHNNPAWQHIPAVLSLTPQAKESPVGLFWLVSKVVEILIIRPMSSCHLQYDHFLAKTMDLCKLNKSLCHFYPSIQQLQSERIQSLHSFLSVSLGKAAEFHVLLAIMT